MIFLLLSIVLTSSLILFFKLYEKYNVNTLQAIVVNYFIAAALGILFSTNTNGFETISQSHWIYYALPLGFLFISIFYTASISTVKIGVSATTVANKMSLIIPVGFAFYLYSDKITGQKIAGILLALLSVILTSKKETTTEKHTSTNLIIFPAIVFLGSGLIDTIVKFVQNTHLKGSNNDLFLGTSFLTAGIIGLIFVAIRFIFFNEKFQLKSIAWGIALGIPNYFSIYTLIKALDSGRFESSVFYPINNIGIVVVSALAAFVFFKEKLSKTNWIGIAIALISIILISV